MPESLSVDDVSFKGCRGSCSLSLSCRFCKSFFVDQDKLFTYLFESGDDVVTVMKESLTDEEHLVILLLLEFSITLPPQQLKASFPFSFFITLEELKEERERERNKPTVTYLKDSNFTHNYN
ncbi:unnamed protein product [Lepeophtheirus salmonis]|uniref:(salmon louse) hypothetical protein n=1 Tax=Lepeophtheirus salmonis TaxID=72036 RepID=A0A7R8CHQ2_LEPSM|nr:unnamed protein product [Lepeophtheirus salmonis]CAF2825959.1 unnamed protein product [Lepeophtheirus salmonis]